MNFRSTFGVLVLFVLYACAPPTRGTPADPVFALNRTSDLFEHTGGVFATASITDYNAARASVIAKARNFVEAARQLVPTNITSENQYVLERWTDFKYQTYDDILASQFAETNVDAANTIINSWPPSIEECEALCGEQVPSASGDVVYRLGTCQRALLQQYASDIASIASSSAEDMETLSPDRDIYENWFSSPRGVTPTYWTVGGDALPIYLLNGFCTCRPGFGSDSEFEDAIYSTTPSPFGTWAGGDTVAEAQQNITGTVGYTGSGRAFMGTHMSWHRMFQQGAFTDMQNVILGWKLPMTCGHRVQRMFADSPLTDDEWVEASAFGFEKTLLDLVPNECTAVGITHVEHNALACLQMLGWGDHVWVKSTSRYEVMIPLSGPVTLTQCLAVTSDLNTAGFCNCPSGFGDTDFVSSGSQDWRLLERPYDAMAFVPSEFYVDALSTMNQGQDDANGCLGVGGKWYCMNVAHEYEYVPTRSPFSGGDYRSMDPKLIDCEKPDCEKLKFTWSSPRCDDLRQCAFATTDPRKRAIPFRVGVRPGGRAPLSEKPSEVKAIYSPDGLMKTLALPVQNPRTCKTSFCTSAAFGSYVDGECECVLGRGGDHCELDGNSHFCNGNGVYHPDTGNCTCYDSAWHDTATVGAYSTEQCALDCGEENCNGNGQCSMVAPACVCEKYYVGATCGTSCATQHCNSHGNCTFPFVSCACEAGFTGDHCHVNPRFEFCSGHGTPVNTTATPTAEALCVCDKNYYGSDCGLYVGDEDTECEHQLSANQYDSTFHTMTHIYTGGNRVPKNSPLP